MLDLSSNGRFWNSEDEISAKSQTLSLELKNFSFSGSISTSFICIGASTICRSFPMMNKISVLICVLSILLLLWRSLKTEDEKTGFYTRNNTKTNKRINVNSFLPTDFFNKEFKIVLEIFHLFMATNNIRVENLQ